MTPTSRPKREWLTVKEAASHIGTSEKIIYTACRRHELRHVKLAHSRYGKIRIRIEWVERWMAGKAVGGEE